MQSAEPIARPSSGSRLVRAACFAMFAVAIGCDGPAHEYGSTVAGTVTIDGELAKSGTVTFHPVKEGLPAVGQIHSDGSYSLRTGQGDLRETDGGTVVPGEYLVTVSITAPPAEGAVIAEGGPPVPGPSLIDAKYSQKDTTDLQRTVKPGKNIFVLELNAAEPVPLEASEETAPQEGQEGAENGEPSAQEGSSIPETGRETNNDEPNGSPSEDVSGDEAAPAPAAPENADSSSSEASAQ